MKLQHWLRYLTRLDGCMVSCGQTITKPLLCRYYLSTHFQRSRSYNALYQNNGFCLLACLPVHLPTHLPVRPPACPQGIGISVLVELKWTSHAQYTMYPIILSTTLCLHNIHKYIIAINYNYYR